MKRTARRNGRKRFVCVAGVVILALASGSVVSSNAAGEEHIASRVGRSLAGISLGLAAHQTPTGPTDIAAGSRHTCALRANGSITCWGSNENGQLNVPAGEFTAVTGGDLHTCALRTDGSIACWGDNRFGQLNVPVGEFTAVVAGVWHSCGLRIDATITCWGDSVYWTSVPAAGRYSAVAPGWPHACGLRTDGSIDCWGRVGTPDFGYLNAPVGQFSGLASAGNTTCGLRSDGNTVCWGLNTQGQADPPSGQFSGIFAGARHFCGLRADAAMVCWGYNVYGQADAPGGRFSDVDGGWGHTCGLRTDGTVVCWGWNDYGQTDVPAEFAGDRVSTPEDPVSTPTEPVTTPEEPVTTPEEPVATPEDSEEEPEGTWPGPPRNLRLDLVEGPGLRIRWDAPADDGGAPVTGYTVDVQGSSPIRMASYPVSAQSRSYELWRAALGATYSISVDAQNRFGAGDKVWGEITPCPGDPWAKSHRMVAEDIDWSSLDWSALGRRLYAQVDFWRVKEQPESGVDRDVMRGARGGIVGLDATVALKGCWWIFENAELADKARLEGNAVLAGTTRVKNNAQVSGNALVLNAVISGNAKVTDDAEVSNGAHVHGHATISGGAKVRGGEVSGSVVDTGDDVVLEGMEIDGSEVSGSVVVTGGAVVLEGMIVDGSDCATGVVCIYDGKQEFDRAAQEVLDSMYTEAFTRFADCGQDAEWETNNLIYPRPGSVGSANQRGAADLLWSCGHVETHRELAKILAEDAAGLVFGFALGLRGSFQLPRFIATLLDAVDVATAVGDIHEITEHFVAAIDRAQQDLQR